MQQAQTRIPFVRLDDGIEIPQLGLTLFQVPPEETRDVVMRALELGCRHFDTAAAHGNEKEVGEAFAASGLPREEYFVTGKLSNLQSDPRSTLDAFEEGLERLGLDHLDLLLIHVAGLDAERLLGAWQALEWIHGEEAARAIGVANFGIEELELLEREGRARPAVNQIELNPRCRQSELCALHAARGIATQAWAPLGHDELLGNPLISRISKDHGKTPAQVILRWHLQLGHLIATRAISPARVCESLGLFDFELCHRELAAIADLGHDRQMLLR